jgi:CRISPR-associated protein Cmr1
MLKHRHRGENMPEMLEAKFRIVTPMFLGGANQDVSDGIRPPSVKGALRFWWRALNWGRFAESTSCAESALILLHDEEVRLFGGSAEQGGQGRFSLGIEEEDRRRQPISDWPQNNTGAGYLAFGILPSGSQAQGNYKPHRQGIDGGRLFQVRLVFRPNTKDADVASIKDSLNAWSLFGGLGSRARRGMGSISLCGYNGSLPDLADFQASVNSVLQRFDRTPVAPFSAFSKESTFRRLSTDSDPRIALSKAGEIYRNYRGQASALRGVAKIPFGLPLQDVDTNSRRASPLFFHVQAIADKQFAACVLFLPATIFHPKYRDVSYANVVGFARGAST